MREIGVIPSIKETYKNQIEYSFDVRINKILKQTLKKVNVSVLNFDSKIDKRFSLIIICGGNDLPTIKKNTVNKVRYKLTNEIFKKAIVKNIPMLGICYGAQFIAKKFNSKFKQKKNVGQHKIFLLEKKKYTIVNSYKNTIIKKLGNDLNAKGIAKDNSIEYFKHKNKNILGIQWHPERYKKFKFFDKKLIKSLCI